MLPMTIRITFMLLSASNLPLQVSWIMQKRYRRVDSTSAVPQSMHSFWAKWAAVASNRRIYKH